MAKNSLTLDYLREALYLDKTDYTFYWKEDRPKGHFNSERSYRMYLGKYSKRQAGYVGLGGYRVVQFAFGGKVVPIKEHHLVWRFINGCDIPKDMMIDHINGVRSDNSIENLRLVISKENGKNQKKNSKNTSGFSGVSRNHNKYRSRITVDGQLITLGNFSTPEEAHEAWLKAKDDFGFYENHGRDRLGYSREYAKVKSRKEGLM